MTNTSTGIEWTDTTWNPVTGCTPVSAGCDHCYADAIATRFAGTPAFPNGFTLTLRPERLRDPLRWRRPRRVFVNSMSDLFHERVPDHFIAEVFAAMALARQHTYQLLTKRHGRMRSLLSRPDFLNQVAEAASEMIGSGVRTKGMGDGWTATPSPHGNIWTPPWPLPHVWLGVSVEDQKRADLRVPALLDTPAAVRWLSCEPLLGPVDLNRTDKDAYVDGGIDWVVVGGESGPAARPMHPAWAINLRNQCVGARIPFFFKQWGTWAPVAPDRGIPGRGTGRAVLAPDGTRHQITPDQPAPPGAVYMARYGKTRAGRTLLGETWNQYPPIGGDRS
ncbi:DUF5131 family protein [Phytohabitans rumicis]|uniref:Phage Gp37/Gp68 family protein n=1 Tax=Phytohabitans rumicis TaxID=1076125 RepID=A0A6V8KRU0_9ACTN|nr:phage Gp37/Gp68 family protein [Phytohabitans rumicis]GFJ87853.1 hypothetical protein Prum_014950 [Phytohabitans rumicis]